MKVPRPEGEASATAARDDVDIVRDRALVAMAQHGDRAAFEELYDRYYRRLWRFCYKRLRDEHEAEDVVQESFVRAWGALAGFGGDRRFYPWLSVIASHLCSNVLRARNRSEPTGQFHERHLVSWEDWGEDRAMADDDRAMAARAFARLPERHRTVLSLREARGWSYQRIADHQGVRVSTIESLLWRAREALKREFAAESGTGMAGALLFGFRRWLRAPQALLQRTGALVPGTASMLVTTAGVAAGALAVTIGTVGPGVSGISGAFSPVPLAGTAGLVARAPTWVGAGAGSPTGTGGVQGAVSASGAGRGPDLQAPSPSSGAPGPGEPPVLTAGGVTSGVTPPALPQAPSGAGLVPSTVSSPTVPGLTLTSPAVPFTAAPASTAAVPSVSAPAVPGAPASTSTGTSCLGALGAPGSAPTPQTPVGTDTVVCQVASAVQALPVASASSTVPTAQTSNLTAARF